MENENIYQIAERAAQNFTERMYENGNGDKAERLRLISADERNLGGWGKAPFRDHAVLAIRDAIRETVAQTPDVTAPNEALLACPFCGWGVAYGQRRKNAHSDWQFYASCINVSCGARNSLAVGLGFATKQEAAKRWNRRAGPALLERIAEMEAQAAWVDVNDRLPMPEKYVPVMIANPYSPLSLEYFSTKYGEWSGRYKVFAWFDMPPYAPKEANEKIMDSAKA